MSAGDNMLAEADGVVIAVSGLEGPVPMTDAWLRQQLDAAITVARHRFGDTDAGAAGVLRGFANRVLMFQAWSPEQRAAAMAVPFTENPAEPAAEAAP